MKENFIRIYGWMKYNKHGSTLIELEVHIFILIIIFILSLTAYREIINFYSKSIDELSVYNELDDAYVNLKNVLSGDEAERTEVKGNSIFVYCFKMYKIIINEDNKLKIKYYTFTDGGIESATYQNYNLLLDNVDNFEVIKKNKLIYAKVCKGGINYIMCL